MSVRWMSPESQLPDQCASELGTSSSLAHAGVLPRIADGRFYIEYDASQRERPPALPLVGADTEMQRAPAHLVHVSGQTRTWTPFSEDSASGNVSPAQRRTVQTDVRTYLP